MKAIFNMLGVFICWCAASLMIYGVSYMDTCDSISGNEIKTYTGFSRDPASVSGLPQTTLAVEGETASVEYQIKGAENMSIELYSDNSTFALKEGKQYYWGLNGSYPGNGIRCFYDPIGRQPFLQINGEIYLPQKKGVLFLFQKSEGVSLVGSYYGVNVEVSFDGNTFEKIQWVSLENAVQLNSPTVVKETYSVQIPKDAVKIRVVLWGGREIPLLSASQAPLRLASVLIEGSQMEIGPEEPPSSSESSSESSSSKPSSSESSSSKPSSSESSSSKPSSSESSSSKPSSSESSSSKPSSSESSSSEPSSSSQTPSQSSSDAENSSTGGFHKNSDKSGVSNKLWGIPLATAKNSIESSDFLEDTQMLISPEFHTTPQQFSEASQMVFSSKTAENPHYTIRETQKKQAPAVFSGTTALLILAGYFLGRRNRH